MRCTLCDTMLRSRPSAGPVGAPAPSHDVLPPSPHEAYETPPPTHVAAASGLTHPANAAWKRLCGLASTVGRAATPVGQPALAHILDGSGTVRSVLVPGGRGAAVRSARGQKALASDTWPDVRRAPATPAAPAARARDTPPTTVVWHLRGAGVTVLGPRGPLWTGHVDVLVVGPFLARNVLAAGAAPGHPSAHPLHRVILTGYAPHAAVLEHCGRQRGQPALHALDGATGIATSSPAAWAAAHPAHAAWTAYLAEVLPDILHRAVLTTAPGTPRAPADVPSAPSASSAPDAPAPSLAAASDGVPSWCSDTRLSEKMWPCANDTFNFCDLGVTAARIVSSGEDSSAFQPCGHSFPVLGDRPCGAWNDDGQWVPGYMTALFDGGVCCSEPPDSTSGCAPGKAVGALHPAFSVAQMASGQPDGAYRLATSASCAPYGKAPDLTRTTPLLTRGEGQTCGFGSADCATIFGASTGITTRGSFAPTAADARQLSFLNATQAARVQGSPQLLSWCTRGPLHARSAQFTNGARTMLAPPWWSDDYTWGDLSPTSPGVLSALSSRVPRGPIGPMAGPTQSVPLSPPATWIPGVAGGSAELVLCPASAFTPATLTVDAAYMSDFTVDAAGSSALNWTAASKPGAPVGAGPWADGTWAPDAPAWSEGTPTITGHMGMHVHCTLHGYLRLSGVPANQGPDTKLDMITARPVALTFLLSMKNYDAEFSFRPSVRLDANRGLSVRLNDVRGPSGNGAPGVYVVGGYGALSLAPGADNGGNPFHAVGQYAAPGGGCGKGEGVHGTPCGAVASVAPCFGQLAQPTLDAAWAGISAVAADAVPFTTDRILSDAAARAIVGDNDETLNAIARNIWRASVAPDEGVLWGTAPGLRYP